MSKLCETGPEQQIRPWNDLNHGFPFSSELDTLQKQESKIPRVILNFQPKNSTSKQNSGDYVLTNDPLRNATPNKIRKNSLHHDLFFHVRQNATKTTPVRSKIIVHVLSICTGFIRYGVGHALLVYDNRTEWAPFVLNLNARDTKGWGGLHYAGKMPILQELFPTFCSDTYLPDGFLCWMLFDR